MRKMFLLVENEYGELLLSNNVTMGKWSIPSVMVNVGLDPREAIGQAVQKEFGIEIVVQEQLSDDETCVYMCNVHGEEPVLEQREWNPKALAEHRFWSRKALQDRKIPFRLPDEAPVSLAYIALNMTPEEETILQRFVLCEPLVYQI